MNQGAPGYKSQKATRTDARVVGITCISTAIVLIGLAVADFFSAASSDEFGAEPTKFWMFFLALPFVAVGGFAIQAGFGGAYARYAAGELAPTAKDTLDYLGFGRDSATCTACGGRSEATAKFCDECGKSLSRACPGCGKANAGDARFCADCGTALA